MLRPEIRVSAATKPQNANVRIISHEPDGDELERTTHRQEEYAICRALKAAEINSIIMLSNSLSMRRVSLRNT